MKPITFACQETVALAPEEIAEQILDATKWSSFRGYRPIPGIRSAEFKSRTRNTAGSRIRVTNQDGSSHVEQIVGWQPDRRLRLEMKDFSPPLSRWATRFVETWDFERAGAGTRVVRTLELYARRRATRPLFCVIALLLKRAVARHLTDVKQAAQPR